VIAKSAGADDGTMLGLFGIFGRSVDLQRIDDALRARGLHPNRMPEAVKLTVLKQLKEAHGGRSPSVEACATAAELLVYCALGTKEFAESNGPGRTESAEARLLSALETGYGPDARLVLLALHAQVIHPGVVERFNLVSE
jgi:hypothetical protein